MSTAAPADLEGRVALVTGAGGAIGSAVVADLSALGAEVVGLDRDADALAELAAGHRSVRVVTADLARPDDVDRALDEVGPVDVLVANAGLARVGPFADDDSASWDELWAVNLRSVLQVTQRLVPAMAERGWGRAVLVSSDGARAGSGGEVAYAATKAGLFGLAKSLAREVARHGVTVNVVCPGPIDTPMLRSVAAANPGLVDRLARQIPARRLGTPDDVAAAVAFLAGERAGYVTGQLLSVNGGITMP